MNLSEQQLSEALRRGDRTAQRELFVRLGGHLMAVALRYMGSASDEARDVVQDAMVKILTRAQHFNYQGEGSLRAWCTRLVVNECIDHLRRHATLLETYDGLMPENLPDEETDGTPMLIPPETLTRLIGQLPPGYRAVLNLYVFEQLSHREIGQRLGIGEKSSASQYLRAKQKLKQLIKNHLKSKEG